MLRDSDYADLQGTSLVMITAGANEKTGGATDRNDPAGRLRLLDTNVGVYKDIIPRLHAAAPQAAGHTAQCARSTVFPFR